MTTKVFEYDVAKQLDGKYKSRIFKKIDVATVVLEIDDKVMDALEASKDRDLAAVKIVEKGQKICEAATATLAEKLKQLDTEAQGKPEAERTKLVRAYRAEMVKELEGLNSKLKVLPEEQWKKFLVKYGEAKKEYKSYKVNAAIDVTVGTLGVAASAAAIGASAHTGGASLVLGCIGMVRSVAKISEVVYSIAIDVEKQSNALTKDLNGLKADFDAQSKAKAVGKDLAKTAVNAVFGAPFFTTVSTIDKKAETLAGKIAGAYVGGVKLAREVTESLNEQKALAAKLDKMKVDGAKAKAQKKVEEQIGKLEKNFGKLFDKAADLNAKAQRTEAEIKAIRKLLAELQDGTKALSYVEKAMTALVSIGLAAGAAGVGISEAAGEALELAKEGVGLANEVFTAAKEAFD